MGLLLPRYGGTTKLIKTEEIILSFDDELKR